MKNNKEEEITDIIDELKLRYTAKNFKKMNIKKGRSLIFNYEGSPVYLEITRVEGKRYWAKHIELHDPTHISSHLKHNIDSTGEVTICLDCEVPITEPATPAGKARFEARKDQYLEDGTFIGEQE